MNAKIRLGPVAVFLTIIAAVLASLAMLSVATSRADAALAERFAAVTKIKYGLEADGNRFLQEADRYFAGKGALPEGCSETDGELVFSEERDGYTLSVKAVPDGVTYRVTEWKIRKIWDADDPMQDLWPGM